MLLYLGAVLILCCGYYVAHIFSSPLRQVPSAHWSSRFSSIWILWTRYSGNELSRLIEAHEKYGPIVQVGPRDLSVSSYQDGIRKIYDAGFPKPASFFALFDYFERRNAFTSLERNEHGVRRRRTAALYSKSALLQSEHLQNVTNRIIHERLLPMLKKAAEEGRQIDGLDLSYCICPDFLSSFLFGYSNGTDYLCQPQSVTEWRAHYENTMCHETFFVQEMPRLYKLMKSLGINLLPGSYAQSKHFLEKWVSDMVSKADATIDRKRQTGLPVALADDPVVYETAKMAVEKDSPHLSREAKREEVGSEMFDHISASREVLGLVLGYAFWYIAQNLGAQQTIREELVTRGIDLSCPPQSDDGSEHMRTKTAAKLDSLPYLKAVIDESLRMRPTSTPLPRVTPPDRVSSVAGIDNIPPGTRINSFQWFIHRDPAKWDNVHEWRPERWLQRDTDRKQSREDVLWAFVSGPRTCLGNNLTYYVMQHVLAAIFANFTFTALPRIDEKCWPGSPEDKLPIKVSLINP
ncbi:cytochrome P450 [Xylaria sp. CBS 124048]|nr:cytochrome P450 [Xylaria sp. CBS 124048]